jgi:hypothetical protein
MRKGSGKIDFLLTPCPPAEKSICQNIKEMTVKQLDGLSSLPISPVRSPPKDTELNTSDSQQSIVQTPQLVFQAPSPPNKADLCFQQEKVTLAPSDNINLISVCPPSASTKAETMLSSTDSKEFLPDTIMQLCKPQKERVSKIPRSSRGNNTVLVSNE